MPKLDPRVRFYRHSIAEQCMLSGWEIDKIHKLKDDKGKLVFPSRKAAETAVDEVKLKWAAHDSEWFSRSQSARALAAKATRQRIAFLNERLERILLTNPDNDKMILAINDQLMAAHRDLYYYETDIDPQEYLDKVREGQIDDQTDYPQFRQAHG